MRKKIKENAPSRRKFAGISLRFISFTRSFRSRRVGESILSFVTIPGGDGHKPFALRIVMNVSTIWGSNCVPLQRLNSAMASSTERAFL